MLTRAMAIGTVVFCLLFLANAGHATLILIQPGAEGKDTWVSSGSGGNDSHENATNLNVGLTPTQYALIEFDLSLVPSGSTINSASLSLYRGSGSNWLNVSVHEITGSWLETVTYNTLPSWDTSAEATTAVGPDPAAWYSWNLTPLTQEWVNDPNTNFGVLLTLDAANGAKGFYSSDRGTANAEYRPKIEIDYTPVPIPPTVLILGTSLLSLFVMRMRRKNV